MSALEDALVLLSKPGEAYDYSERDPTLRKFLNRAMFERILIHVVDRQTETEGVPYEVYSLMLQTAQVLGLSPQAPPDANVQGSPAGWPEPSPYNKRTPVPKPEPGVRTSTK